MLGASALAGPNLDDGLQGFSGSNGRGFSGSNGRGFSGSNGRGFSGSNGRGFSGSNGRGFSGSNGRGFSGSNGRGFSGSNGRGYGDQTTTSGFGAGFGVAAMGVVDEISVNAGAVALSVAGQTFSVDADEAGSFAIGDYVVAGAEGPGLPAIVYHVGAPYAAGVSVVRVKATVDSVELAVGRLMVGALMVDYTAHLSADPSTSPVAGDVLEAVGVQPVAGGVLLVGSSGDDLSLSESGENTARQ